MHRILAGTKLARQLQARTEKFNKIAGTYSKLTDKQIQQKEWNENITKQNLAKGKKT